MTRYTVTLDGIVRATNLQFRDAVWLATQLQRKIQHINASKRIQITEQ